MLVKRKENAASEFNYGHATEVNEIHTLTIRQKVRWIA